MKITEIYSIFFFFFLTKISWKQRFPIKKLLNKIYLIFIFSLRVNVSFFHTMQPSLFVLGLELDLSFPNWRYQSCHPRPRSISRTQSSPRTLFFRSKASSSSAIFGEHVQRVRKWCRRLQKAKTWMLGWVVSARRTFVECMSNCETSSGEFS